MAMRRFDPRQAQRGPQIRINHRIRVPEIRVIGDDGEMLGILPTQEALRRAQDRGLDLVEVNPKADPPVCKILDFGKYKYDEKKKAREAKRKQTVVEIKEIKLRPKTDDHDLDFKARAAQRFLEAGHKVKFTVRFRGREITHPEKAQEQLDWIVQQCEELANVEVRPAMEQRTMTLLMAPKPFVMQKVAAARVAAEKARQRRVDDDGRDGPVEEESDAAEAEDLEKLEAELKKRADKDDAEDDEDDKDDKADKAEADKAETAKTSDGDAKAKKGEKARPGKPASRQA
jgi:translation initiation factor IF-3